MFSGDMLSGGAGSGERGFEHCPVFGVQAKGIPHPNLEIKFWDVVQGNQIQVTEDGQI